MPKVIDAFRILGDTSTSTLKVTTGAVLGQFLSCANASTGAASWTPIIQEKEGIFPTSTYDLSIATTLSATDCIVVIAGQAAAKTLTLPVLAATFYGRLFVIKNAHATEPFTLAAGAANTIDAAASIVMQAGDKISLIGGPSPTTQWLSI